MLPPGLSFNAASNKALKASKTAKLPRSYWSWDEMEGPNEKGFFPYTPATNLLYGLAEAIDMLQEEGLDKVFARHDRHAEATRRAVRAWGLERSEEHTSELQSLMRISYAVFCLKTKKNNTSMTFHRYLHDRLYCQDRGS